MARLTIGCPACGERRWIRPARAGDVAIDVLTAAAGVHRMERRVADRPAEAIEAGRWRCISCGRPAGVVVRAEIEDLLREISAY